jgi:hypothetical protein
MNKQLPRGEILMKDFRDAFRAVLQRCIQQRLLLIAAESGNCSRAGDKKRIWRETVILVPV